MTVLIKSKDVGKYCIEITQEKHSSSYTVSLYAEIPSKTSQFRRYEFIDSRSYPTKESANRRFNSLVRRCRNEM